MRKRMTVAACVAAVLILLALGADARATTTVSGSVVSPSGEPVEGAEVIVATPEQAAWPNLSTEERDDARGGAATTYSDKAGRFTVAVPDGPALLSIAHPKAGCAKVKPDALGEGAEPVKLEPWGRVEGTVKVGAKPAPAGTKVSLGVFYSTYKAPAVHYGHDVYTDAQGRYVLERVPAGVNQIRVKTSATGSPLERYVGAEPGKTVRFDVGGRGRPVIGKLAIDGADVKELSNPDPKKRQLISQSHFRRDLPWPKPPYFTPGVSAQEAEDILSNWRRTPEAVEQWKDQYRCTIDFQPDGSYRFDDVPPGRYFLTLTIYQRGGEAVAKRRIEVVVPETPAVPTDEPLDLGEQRFEAKVKDSGTGL